MFSGGRRHHLQSYTTKTIAYLKAISQFSPYYIVTVYFRAVEKCVIIHTALYVALYTDKVLTRACDSFTG